MVDKLRDVVVTVSFAVSSNVTLEQAKQFAAEAVAAKLDMAAELADWGEQPQRFYYNGECADAAHWER